MSRRPFVFVLAALIAVLVAVPVARAAINRGSPGSGRVEVQALAALGSGFTYQGRLTDAGAPANGIYDLRFILYDAEAGGTQVGSTIEKANLQVQNGLFSTELDFGAASFDGNARWLEIGIRPGDSAGTYTVLSPRQPINPVPYAIYAKTAGLALPFTGTANTAADTGLINVTQSGAGAAFKGAAAGGVGGSFSGATGLVVSGTTQAANFTGTVNLDGNLLKDYGGAANQPAIPIAYGYVLANGTLSKGTGNVTSAWVTDHYEIGIAGESVLFSNYVVVVTPVDGAIPNYGSLSNKLTVTLLDPTDGTTEIQGRFSFVVFKP